MNNNESIFSFITNKLSDSFKLEERRIANEDLRARVAKRFMKILTEVSLNSIYRIPTFYQTSLYTFLSTSFELYKLEQFQKKKSSPVG